ncbi:MAG: DUF3149 domain-containing protein [Gammaproteobacteria bacterium]
MELWLDLLFGNPVGLSSMLVVLTTFAVIVYILAMFVFKSGHKES